MRSRSISAMFLALGLALSAAGTAMAKGDAVVTLDEALPTDPAPGSTITVAWTLDIPDGNGSTLPFNAEGVFVRFTPAIGEPVEVVAQQDRQGHYTARVTVPEGGLGSAVFGLKGEACFAGGGCQRSDMLFPLATEARQPAADPAAVPVAPVAPVAQEPLAQPPVAQPPVAQPPAAGTPTQTATSPAAATVDMTWLPLVALVGLAAAGLARVVRGRGRASAT